VGTYKTTIANSAVGVGTLFSQSDAAASTYLLEAGAFLHSTSSSSIILSGVGAWTVTINGQASGPNAGLFIQGAGAAAKVTVGEDGSLRSSTFGAFYADRDTALVNKGMMYTSLNSAAQLLGTGTNSVVNSGMMSGGNSVSISFYNASNDTVTNSGQLFGGIAFTDGTNKLVNTGQISFGLYGATSANVYFGSGADTVDNTGVIDGRIELGNGSNVLKNAGKITGADVNGNAIIGGNDADKVDNLKGGVVNSGLYMRDGLNTFTNAGTVGSNNSAFSYQGGAGIDTVTNAGVLGGIVNLYGGNDVFTNTGVVNGYVDLGSGLNKATNSKVIAGIDGDGLSVLAADGNDTLTNAVSGTLAGGVYLGIGLNIFTNAGTVGEDSAGNSFTGGDDIIAFDTLKNSGTLQGDVQLFAGNDVFTNTGQVNGVIDLGDGNDKFTGGNFAEVLRDNSGTDTIVFGGGNDVFIAYGGEGDGKNGLLGNPAPDSVDGGTGIDTYDGSAVSDVGGIRVNLDIVDNEGILKGSARDASDIYIDMLKGFENVTGSSFLDVIYGSSVANVISGGGGTDYLYGLAGNDILEGGADGDRLAGGLGADILRGGAGADTFYYMNLKDSGLTKATRDVIEDYNEADDFLDLSLLDADTRSVTNDSFDTIITTGGFVLGDAQSLRIYQTATGWMIEGEVTGDAKADFSIAVNDLDYSINWVFGSQIFG
jgi:Ca2+-binding RTX toxin-like protein